MEPIRVIGRIDLAQRIHAALLAVGADTRLTTAAPGAVLEETGRDGTGIDILANAFDTCSAIKKAAPRRPVVMITFEEQGGAAPSAEAYAAMIAGTSRGPEAHLPWPATGVEILAACDRAREAAPVPRPRFTRRIVLQWCALLGLVAAVSWVVVDKIARQRGEASSTTVVVASFMQAVIFGAFAWQSWRSRTVPARRWRIVGAAFCVLLAGWSFANGMRALYG